MQLDDYDVSDIVSDADPIEVEPGDQVAGLTKLVLKGLHEAIPNQAGMQKLLRKASTNAEQGTQVVRVMPESVEELSKFMEKYHAKRTGQPQKVIVPFTIEGSHASLYNQAMDMPQLFQRIPEGVDPILYELQIGRLLENGGEGMTAKEKYDALVQYMVMNNPSSHPIFAGVKDYLEPRLLLPQADDYAPKIAPDGVNAYKLYDDEVQKGKKIAQNAEIPEILEKVSAIQPTRGDIVVSPWASSKAGEPAFGWGFPGDDIRRHYIKRMRNALDAYDIAEAFPEKYVDLSSHWDPTMRFLYEARKKGHIPEGKVSEDMIFFGAENYLDDLNSKSRFPWK